MNGIVERVAKALLRQDLSFLPLQALRMELLEFEDCSDAIQEKYLALARAAIEAMHEPTEREKKQ